MTTKTKTSKPRKGWPVPWSEAPWYRAVVYGMGLSGRAATELLLDREVEVVAVDRRSEAELDLGDLAVRDGFELAAGGELRALPPGIDGVVVSPGVSPDQPLLRDARARGIPVLAEVEIAFPLLDGPVVGITGSNGKSTTTALAGAMIAASGKKVEVCGNIGKPLASCVHGPRDRIFVVELSSFQLEGIRTFRPRAAALLNLAPDHLDRYPDMRSYGAAKAMIFAHQGPEDIAVLNADDPWVASQSPPSLRRFFSRRRAVPDGCYLDGDRVIEMVPGSSPQELFAVTDLPLAGVHNLENAMAAALLARSVGTDTSSLRNGLKRFRGLPHRMEKVGEFAGVSWWDDSKGTNPAATAKSLEGFPDASVHLILGGRNKGADFRDLAGIVGRKARRVYLIGESARELADALSGVAPHEHCGTLERAVTAAEGHIRAGEAVVLSPACASFDQFQNFMERGRHFQHLVRDGVIERQVSAFTARRNAGG